LGRVVSKEEPLFPSFNYYLDKSDPDIVILSRQDCSFVAPFSARGLPGKASSKSPRRTMGSSSRLMQPGRARLPREREAGRLSAGLVSNRIGIRSSQVGPKVLTRSFGYAVWVATRRISAVVEAAGENLGWIGRVHRRTDLVLGYGLRPQEAAVVRGIVLGDRSLMPEDLEEALRRSGITHTCTPPRKIRNCFCRHKHTSLNLA
jgi:hypothetical protein